MAGVARLVAASDQHKAQFDALLDKFVGSIRSALAAQKPDLAVYQAALAFGASKEPPDEVAAMLAAAAVRLAQQEPAGPGGEGR